MTLPEQNSRLSFTTGGLFVNESVLLAKAYVELGDWDLAREEALESNLLQARTQATSKRVCRELAFRLAVLTPEQLQLFVVGSPEEQRCLLWYANCRYYKLIGDFATEVLRERYLSLQIDLQLEEFDYFYNKKADLNEQLEAITDMTRRKLRQVLYRMMREADFLSDDGLIKAAIVPARVIKILKASDLEFGRFFPAFDADLVEPDL